MWIKIVLVAEIVFTVGQVRSDSTKLSRACYGSPGLPCTEHKLVCDKQHAKIAIEDAYFTEDKTCPEVGISTCGNIADNIPDDSQHRRFNSTQLKILNKDCSAKKECSSRAPRINAGQIRTLSIVKYQCIENAGSGAEGNTQAGVVVGGIIAALLVITVVVLVMLWLKYKRNHKAKPTLSNGKSPDENNYIATTMPVHKYHEIEAKKVNKSTEDCATVGVKNTGMKRLKLEEDYDIIDENQLKKGGHFDTTFLSAKSHINNSFAQNEDDYNHLVENGMTKTIENGIHPVGYDTAASACKSVQQIRNKGVSDVDSDCDYNHIDNNPKPKPLQGDYDTTASASKAVVKMMETNEQTEDDYDHFRQTKAGSQAADSPYNTAVHQAEHSGDYSIAGALQKHDPYDLAK